MCFLKQKIKENKLMFYVLETYLKNKDKRQKSYMNEVLSKIPDDTSKQESVRKDMSILRAAIIAELDAINLYEQFASQVTNENVKKVLLDVANEEKEHVGEFEGLLKEVDPEYKELLISGEKEVEDEIL
jgi:rubrerythrin